MIEISIDRLACESLASDLFVPLRRLLVKNRPPPETFDSDAAHHAKERHPDHQAPQAVFHGSAKLGFIGFHLSLSGDAPNVQWMVQGPLGDATVTESFCTWDDSFSRASWKECSQAVSLTFAALWSTNQPSRAAIRAVTSIISRMVNFIKLARGYSRLGHGSRFVAG
jgi:hypothetical protein